MAHFPLPPRLDALRGLVGDPAAQVAVNLHVETEHNFIEAHVFDYDRLVVTFEDAGEPGPRPQRYREGWAKTPFLKRGVSLLAVKPRWRHWYSTPDLGEALARMAPFLSRFREIVHYGNSMGGFGALTYAGVTGAARVVALAPQSTYAEVDGRREDRYAQALRLEHKGPHADAARAARGAEVWLMYDHMVPEDRWHASRIEGPRVHHVHLPYADHFVVTVFRLVGALDLPVELALTGQLDRARLYALLRRRREFSRYYDHLRRLSARHPSVEARLKRLLLDGGFEALDKNDAFASRSE